MSIGRLASRQNRSVTVAPPTRRFSKTSSGSQSGSTGSTTSVSYGASGTMPASVCATSGKAVAFQSCGALACGYAPGAGCVAAREAADAFRNAVFGIERGEIEQRARQIDRPGVEPEAPQPEDRRRLFDRPDRAAVIAQRVVVAVIATRACGCPSR